MAKNREISIPQALSNKGVARCMDVLTDLLLARPEPPRWIADLKTMELSERQPDNTYLAVYRMVPLR